MLENYKDARWEPKTVREKVFLDRCVTFLGVCYPNVAGKVGPSCRHSGRLFQLAVLGMLKKHWPNNFAEFFFHTFVGFKYKTDLHKTLNVPRFSLRPQFLNFPSLKNRSRRLHRGPLTIPKIRDSKNRDSKTPRPKPGLHGMAGHVILVCYVM